ncbi:unnamed protein product, partial [Allacma fusca]
MEQLLAWKEVLVCMTGGHR